MASLQVVKETSSDNQELKQPQNGVQATMANQTNFPMTLGRSINWSGTPAYPGFRNTIQPNSSIIFNHLSDGNFGSTAAVTYNGFNLTGQPCAWLLAWDAPAESDHKPNKVYVTCGLRSYIDNLDFNDIRLFLSESSTNAFVSEPVSKTTASANINDLLPNMATIRSFFGSMP